MESRSDNSKQHAQWETIKEFKAPVGDRGDEIVLRVERLPLWFPRYSFKLGTMREGKFLPFFAPQIRIENAKVHVEPLDFIVAELIRQAEWYVYGLAQEREDQEIERKQAREARAAAGPQERKAPRTMLPREGKTARDREKTGGIKTNDPRISQSMKGSSSGGGKGKK